MAVIACGIAPLLHEGAGPGVIAWLRGDVTVVLVLGVNVRPFVPGRQTYNTVGRIPYYVACLFSCAAGALDPLGIKLFFMSIPAAFRGSSGLPWPIADSLPENRES
jgi:hypothetical protein